MKNVNTIILDSVYICLDKIKDKLSYDRTYERTITKVNTDDTYEIKIDKNAYTIRNGTSLTFSCGDKVWVTVPCNNLKRMFICAKSN